MSINNNQEGKQLLTSIFKYEKKDQNKLCPIIDDSSNISNLILYLKDKNITIIEKVEIIYKLYEIFRVNDLSLSLFMRRNITNIINFYEPLIDLYFVKDEYINEYKELIEQTIRMILSKVTLTKAPIEYIYKKLSYYYENKETEEKERLNENQILKYIKLLKIFYTVGTCEKSLFEKSSFSLVSASTNESQIIKEIKNYIYFNGKRSSISLALNKNSINPNTDFPTIQYGISFIMWFYIDENLLKKFQEMNSNMEIKLIVINISGEQIKLVLKDIYTLQVSLNDQDTKNIQTNLLKVNDWNNMCFSILEKNGTKLPLKIFINSAGHTSYIIVRKNFPVSSKINSIKLLENFIGKVSSFMIITKVIEQKEANYFSLTKKYGFYKNKILFDFLLSNEKNYFEDCKNYKYYEKCKVNKAISFYDFHINKQNIKNMIAIFCPFTYNKVENQVDDIFGNFIGVLGENDGVNYYVNNSKKIRQLGGINNLLPIIELMYSTISKSKKIKYNLVDKSILTQSTFYEFLNLIKYIIIGHNRNLNNANKSKFFTSLSLFVEKFPSNLFTPKILQILLEIGKENFQNIDKYNPKDYINLILLNEKIISKYNVENQLSLWKNLYSFFTSDDTQIKDSFNIKKICLLLRLFDEKRYNEYCCKKHAEIFKDNNDEDNNYDMNIMEPEMDIRLNELFKIIQIYVDKFCEEEQTINLFQLLSLDLSPCLQKKIIQLYINYFDNKKIEINTKLKAFDILTKNNFIELIEYVFSISLLDIRIDVLTLFKIIIDNKELKNKFHNYMGTDGMNNYYIFISENLLPEKLYVKISDNKINNNLEEKNSNNLKINNLEIKDKNQELIPLENYFNKNVYDKAINNIWNFLLNWIIDRKPASTNSSKTKETQDCNTIRNFVINFCISFVSKSPFNYIDLFIVTIVSYFKDESISNRDILYTNKNLYPWLLETIFCFHNSQIDNHIYKKEDILSIQKNSIDLFQEFFIHRRPHEEINSRIDNVIRYSIFIRKINGSANDKTNLEITRITRLLLQKIMDVSTVHMNYKTKYCFDFLFYHKNYNKLLGVKKNKTNTDLNKFTMNDYLKQSKTIQLPRDFTIENFNINRVATINNTNFISEIINEVVKEKSNDDFNSRKKSNLICTSLNLEPPNSNFKDNKNTISSLNKTEIIPSYLFDNLHCENYEQNNKDEKKEKKGKNLKVIWEDFNLFDNIIDYYSSNVWGIEVLRKKVKADIDSNILSLSKNLLKEYGDNKSYRSILKKNLLKCLNVKNIEEQIKPEKVKINIFNINIILLCIAFEITQDYDERLFLEGKFQQFIIFCVMASININPNEVNYDIIQDSLYDALGFALIFIKKRSKSAYNKFIDNLISPLFELDGPKKFKYFSVKKNTYKNSAICRLFELKEKKKEEPEELDELFINDDDDENAITYRNTINFFSKKSQQEISSKYKDDTNVNNNINLKVEFKGDTNLILKHIFEDTLNKVKEERKFNILYKTNYKKLFKNKFFTDNTQTDEQLRINKIIKKVIPLYETQIKNYANNEYLHEKKRKNKYKSNKAKLFSWQGFWSNKYLFYEHPELLKLKIKNHYTKEMTKPLLVPILDIEYYTPPFKKFDKSKLFNNNNYNYKINLDIDDILLDEFENNVEGNNIIDIRKDNNNFQCVKNRHGFNFLECLYKLSYKDVWEKYQLYSNQKIQFEKIISLNKESYTSLINSKRMSKNIENIQRENIYNCCIVKITHHIKGYISTEKNRFRFIFASDSDIKEEELKNDVNYDKEMQCCFGSIFKNKKNDKDKVVISIDYITIKYIFIRHYFYNETALEIFTEHNKSYYFNFKTNKDLIQFKTDILHHGTYREIKTEDYKGKKILGYQQITNSKKKIYQVINKMEEWQNNNISTLEYLMWLNIYSGRSFNDISQYPVFPWLITNYSEESQEISLKNDLRNLNVPMGMLDLSEEGELRKDNFIETYESIKNDLKEMFPDFNYQEYLKKGDEYLDNYKNKKLKKEKENNEEIAIIEYNQIPYFFGSHYSNPTYVSHFLVRTFPYSYVSIEIQGDKFDDPDRMFISMLKTFQSVSTSKDDVRELIPEFYILPEMFLNKNNLDLTQNQSNSENNLIAINDVKLPLWCNNNSINFVVQLRRYLENNNINNNINKWIDLIFGINQRGEKAEENHNIFQSYTYEKNVKINSIKDIDVRNGLMRQYEMGVTPFQIFDSESKNKIRNNSIITLDESKNLIIKMINSSKFNYLKNKHYENNKYSNDIMYKEENIKLSFLKILKIVYTENEKLKIFTNKNRWYTIKLLEEDINNTNNNIIKVEESNINKYFSNSSKYACSYMISDIETPFIVFNDNRSVIKGGFWDGRLEINHLNVDNKNDKTIQAQTIFNPDYSPITTMKMFKNEKLLLCGTKDGILISYEINEKNIEYKKSYFLFDDEITSISINENLHMFAVSSRDGFINLYIIPSFKLVRTIYLNSNKKEKNDLLYASHIFLSNSPLACITIYINSKRLFKSYTINGEIICDINECDDSSKIKSPIIYTNNSFQDILIYGTNDGFIKMRKFPELTLINSIKVFPDEEINTICVSPDKKHCYVWSCSNYIAVIKDSDITKNS